jgi:hypothetical protein
MNITAIVKSVVNPNTNAPSQKRIASRFSGTLKAFENATEMQGLFKSYFKIDLAQIPLMSPEELGELADKAAEAKYFSDNREKIEKHIKNLIDGIVDYNEFVAACVKSGVQGMKKIDKSTLDVFLGLKDYQSNTQKLAKDSDVWQQKKNQELTDYVDLAEYDLNISLQIMATQMSRKKLELDNKPASADAEELRRFEENEQRRYCNELISYGTRHALPPAAEPKWKQHQPRRQQQDQPNIFQRAKNFFQGK